MQKALIGFKLWQDSHILPDFAFQGKIVWILYNFLSCFVQQTQVKGEKRIGSVYSSRGPSYRSNQPFVSTNEMTHHERAEQVFDFKFTIPEIFPIAANKKHRQLHIEAQKSLNLYVQQKMFGYWKQHYLKVKEFKRKMYLKTLITTFVVLETYATQRAIRRHKVTSYVEAKGKQRTKNMFFLWKNIAFKKMLLKELHYNEVSKREKACMIKFWSIWRNKKIEFTAEKGLLGQAEKFYYSHSLHKGFFGLLKYTVWKNKSRAILEEAEAKKTDLLLRKTLRVWAASTTVKQENNEKKFKAQVVYKKNVLRRMFQAWAKHQNYKQRLSEILSVFKIKNKKVALGRILRSWKKYTKDSIIKGNLVNNLDQHYCNKLINKAFFTLYAYKTRKIAQRERDESIANGIGMLPLRRFFKGWFKASIYNLSLPHFVKMFEALQMKQFFKNIHLKSYKEEMVTRALTENHMYHIKRVFFYAYKKFCRKTKELKVLSYHFRKHTKKNRMHSFFSLWRKRFAFEKNIVYLYAKAVICIKNEILGKCFHHLKKKCYLKKKLALKKMERTLSNKQAAFNGWLLFVKKKNLLTVIYDKYNRTLNQRIKQKYLYKMGQKFAKKNHDREVGNTIIRARKHKFLALWVTSFNMNNARKISLGQFDFVSKAKTPRRPMFNFKLSQKPYREFYHKIKNAHRSYLQSKFFTKWCRFIAKTIFTKEKIGQIRNNANVNLVRNCFTYWRKTFNEQRNFNQKLGNFVNIINRYFGQLFFNELVFTVTRQVESELSEEKALLCYVKNLKNKAFFGWIITIKNQLQKQRNYELATSAYAENLMRKAFITLNEYTRYRVNRKKNSQQAVLIYAFQVMRSHFYYWKKHYLKKSILASKVMEFKRHRMEEAAPIFFQQLKLNFYLDSFKKISTPKVARFYSRFLKIKSFLGFKVNYTRSLLKIQAQEKADSHSVKRLLLKGLKGWLTYLAEKKEAKENRKLLIETIDRVRNENLLSRALSMWKLYTDESLGYVLNIRAVMIENGMRRILAFWKNYTETKKHERSIIENFNNYRTAKNRVEFFQKWKDLWAFTVIMGKLCNNVSHYHLRNSFNEINKTSEQAQAIENYQASRNSKIKARYLDKWVKYLKKLKEDHLREDLIWKKQSKTSKRLHFSAWQKLFGAHLQVRKRERDMLERAFVEMFRILIRSKKHKMIMGAVNYNLLKRSFDRIVLNKTNQKRCKSILSQMLLKKEEMAQQKALSYLENWRNISQEMAFQEQQLSLAFDHANTVLKIKSLNSFKEHCQNSLLAKEFLQRMIAIQNTIGSKLDKLWSFSVLKKYNESQVKVLIGLEKLKKLAFKRAGLLERLINNAIEKDNYLLLASKLGNILSKNMKRRALFKLLNYVSIYEQYEQLASEFLEKRKRLWLGTVLKVLRDYATETKTTRINYEKSNQFLFERYYIGLERTAFFGWKKTLQREKQLVMIQTKLGNSKIARVLKMSFLALKNYKDTRKEKGKLHAGILERAQSMKNRKLVALAFQGLKGVHDEERKKSNKSKLYTVFSSWKLYAKERVLLKKYLQESSNAEEDFAYVPSVTGRKGNDNSSRNLISSSRNFSHFSGY